MIDIRLATEADKGEILARIEELFGKAAAQRVERLWYWQWHRDPRLASPGYRGIVAEWDGRVIGNLGTIPAGLYIRGEPARAWWFVDVLVHFGMSRRALRAHKRATAAGGPDLSRGIAAAMFEHPGAGPIQLGKHVSEPMLAIARRIRFEAQPDSGSFRRRVSLRHPLGRFLGATTGDLLAAVADLALPRIPEAGEPVRRFDGPFDARFDALWSAAKDAYPAICRRDEAVLEWRYRQHPDRDYSVLTLEDGAGLRGYCVVKVFDQGRRRRGKVVDLLTMPADRPAARALLAGALAELRRQRAERADCFATGADLIATLARLGFARRLSESQRPRSLMSRHWPGVCDLYATQGDGDGG
jgi:hypothetical protein